MLKHELAGELCAFAMSKGKMRRHVNDVYCDLLMEAATMAVDADDVGMDVEAQGEVENVDEGTQKEEEKKKKVLKTLRRSDRLKNKECVLTQEVTEWERMRSMFVWKL